MELILVRHGLPERKHGDADPSLSETGRDQAERAARALRAEGVDAVWSSPMKRARETAEPLASALGVDLRTHDGLCEFDRHDTRYIPVEDLQREDPAAFAAMVRAVMTGESHDFDAFRSAVCDALETIIAAHRGERVAVFCHGGVINMWTAHVLGMPTRMFFNPNYTSLNRYACPDGETPRVTELNAFLHLFD